MPGGTLGHATTRPRDGLRLGCARLVIVAILAALPVVGPAAAHRSRPGRPCPRRRPHPRLDEWGVGHRCQMSRRSCACHLWKMTPKARTSKFSGRRKSTPSGSMDPTGLVSPRERPPFLRCVVVSKSPGATGPRQAARAVSERGLGYHRECSSSDRPCRSPFSHRLLVERVVSSPCVWPEAQIQIDPNVPTTIPPEQADNFRGFLDSVMDDILDTNGRRVVRHRPPRLRELRSVSHNACRCGCSARGRSHASGLQRR